MTATVYRSINQHRDLIIAELARIDDLAKYAQLRAQFISRQVTVASDREFQRLYRSYWAMNPARLSERFYAKYFQLLAQCQQSGSVDIGGVARELANVDDGKKKSLQFSFATKLAHMVDPRVPVYDGFVAAFYFYVPPTPDLPFIERIDRLLKFHDFLRHEYERVIHNGLLGDAVGTFRDHFQMDDAVCDERVIDWILWGWVSLLRRQAQQRGEALYL